MKKIVSTVLVCVLLACTLLTLASCGKMLSGAYKAETLLGNTTYEFGAFGKVTCTLDPIVGNNVVKEGKYEFNKDGDEITFTFENEDGEEESETHSFVEGEEGGVKYIKLGIVKYEKVD